MSLIHIAGVLVVILAGLIQGSAPWPMKLMRRFDFEHWWLISTIFGMIIIPWTITLLFCPNALAAYANVPPKALIIANLWALGWGLSNLLCGICLARIGMGLCSAILTGLGVSFGVTIPMIVKGSGLFSNSPGIDSPTGRMIILGVGVMLTGVIITAIAGMGRDRILKKRAERSGSFVVSLLMMIMAGILSCGVSLAFVYAQGPVVAAMKAHGAGEIPSTFAVNAVALLSGGVINIIYAAYMLTQNRSWGVFCESPAEVALSVLIGINSAVAIAMLGCGMRLLGVLGASVGYGIQQASQMLGGQAVGFISGEWRGIFDRPRYQMYLAIVFLITAAGIMAYANALS